MTETNKKYLIVLQGGGDTSILLANPEAKDWIAQPFTPPRGRNCYTEEIPQAVQGDFELDDEEATCEVTSGSYDNDRAMACPGQSFSSMTDLIEHCRVNSIEFVGEYRGYIY